MAYEMATPSSMLYGMTEEEWTAREKRSTLLKGVEGETVTSMLSGIKKRDTDSMGYSPQVVKR